MSAETPFNIQPATQAQTLYLGGAPTQANVVAQTLVTTEQMGAVRPLVQLPSTLGLAELGNPPK